MRTCTVYEGSKGFLKKSYAIAALYFTPSILVKAMSIDKVVPIMVAKEKLSLTIKADPYINSIFAKGIGEIAMIGFAAAVANAVYNATGKRVRDLPITPEKLGFSKT